MHVPRGMKETVNFPLIHVTCSSTYVELVLTAISHIFAVLSADALRINLLSGLHDN